MWPEAQQTTEAKRTQDDTEEESAAVITGMRGHTGVCTKTPVTQVYALKHLGISNIR